MKKTLAMIISVISLIAIGIVMLFIYVTDDLCGNQIHKEYISPNKSLKAVVFQRDCGATTGFSTQISILGMNKELDNEGGNIFIIDGHPDNVAPILNWTNDKQLNIQYSLNGREYKAEEQFYLFHLIKITYND